MSKKYLTKNKFILISFAFILFSFFFLHHNIETNNCKDITYSAKDYLTTGWFNKYKLYNLETHKLIFSDTKYAILEVSGIECKLPHAIVYYKLFMNKDSKGIWYVTKLESVSNF